MKNTKFVFENFDEFLNFMEDRINEAVEFTEMKEVQQRLSAAGLDTEGVKSLGQINDLAKKANPRALYDSSHLGPNGFKSFNGIKTVINALTKQQVTEISDIKYEEQEIRYTNFIAGSVVSKNVGNSSLIQDGRCLAIDVLTYINDKNLNDYKKPEVNSKSGTFTSSEENKNEKEIGFLLRSGTEGQMILTATPGELRFATDKIGELVKNPAAPISEEFRNPIPYNKDKKDKEANKKWSGTFVFYYPVSIEANKGAENSSTEIFSFTRTVSKGGTKLAPIIITNDDVLFEQGKSFLRDEGKAAILNALSNVATAKTIQVTGGASKEGNRETNERLCKDRAKAVADFLRSSSFKNSEITVSDKADIQDSSEKEIDPKRRRVILDIVGEQMVPSNETSKEVVYEAKPTIGKADVLVIKQAAIQINGKCY